MNPNLFGRIFWGLILVTAGAFFLLDQMGLIKIDIAYIFSTYWPIILIFYGLTGFVWQRKYHWGSSVWSVLLCGVGTIFLLHNLKITDLSIGEMFRYLWPVALILFGLNVIFKPWKKHSHADRDAYRDAKRDAREARRAALREEREKYKRQWKEFKWEHHASSDASAHKEDKPEIKRELSEEEKAVLKDIHGEFDPHKYGDAWKTAEETASINLSKHEDATGKSQRGLHHNHRHPRYQTFGGDHSGDTIHRHGFIGDVHMGQEPWELKPLHISHFIGDSVIDLTRASVPLGETPIFVTAFIGDVKIFIPNDIDLEVKVMANSFIGDMKVLDRRESGFMSSVRTETAHFDEAQRKLIVTTSMFIGDITIKKIG